jgi:DNA-binding CsgD family transcriptional regulator
VPRQGADLASRCGAQPLLERAETELLSSGARGKRHMLSGAESLTASERRVADLAAEGASNRQIGQALFVTTKTVEVHLTSVYRELYIGSRGRAGGRLTAGAVAVAVRLRKIAQSGVQNGAVARPGRT